MRTTLALFLVLATLAPAQDAGKRLVEQPIKKAIGAEPGKFDLGRTGIEWTKGLDAAVNKGKPILLFQLLGNFDDVFC